ncbi:MAG: exodeoxyribonuclease VII large subunit [Candidatus Omnitrophica bacterium]|nr:exodeoxyribonuclease VII large subunit [Candidatus Omnitrophota bacterium]MCF7895739.1 exodeoxyribonuclease VII large subunit [Candidatus Omnitrophota bacterium]MCF7897630.1 exodeoxyribonuclease VII large subunit [Candidatus Omnitrophota bacterium]
MDKPRQMNMDDLTSKEKVYSILELNSAVKDAIKAKFSQYIWVCGEIQDMRASRGRGHIYFNCVEKDPDSDTIIAQVSAALFAGRVPKIFNKLKSVDPEFKLKNDIEVKLLCQIDLYPKSGRYNIIVVDIDPVYTLGKIAQNRQKIIADLKKRNLLDKNKEKIFPQLPLKVGLITSLNSAAFADFTNELDSSGFGFKVFACGAHMQGKLVEPDVVKALDYFNKLKKEELDLIVVTRGGGSTADLSYFDSQKIAEKIASLDFPVVAAVGHQINTTIIDLMAHTSCKTPTAAGQCLVEKVQVFLDGLTELERSVLEKSEEILEDKKQGLQNTALRFDSAVTGYFQVQKELLLEKKHSIVNLSKMHLQDQKNKIINIGKDIGSFSKRLLEDSRNYLSHIDEKIKLLDPKNVLKRGYSVTYLKNKAIKSIDDLEIGDKIKTVLYKGEVESEVKGKEDRG